MNKFVIAAVAAALLGSTSMSFAGDDSGREVYQSELDFNLQQSRQVNTVRDARAQSADRQHAVNSFAAADSARFDRNVSPIER